MLSATLTTREPRSSNNRPTNQPTTTKIEKIGANIAKANKTTIVKVDEIISLAHSAGRTPPHDKSSSGVTAASVGLTPCSASGYADTACHATCHVVSHATWYAAWCEPRGMRSVCWYLPGHIPDACNAHCHTGTGPASLRFCTMLYIALARHQARTNARASVVHADTCTGARARLLRGPHVHSHALHT